MLVSSVVLAQEAAVEATSSAPPKTELQMGDLPNNAFTTYSGTYIIHPILPSSYAVSDNLEMKTSLLGLLGGPNFAAEYALVKNSDMALSIEPAVGATWLFSGYSGGATLRYSQKTGSGFFNANVGGSYALVPGLTTVTTSGTTTAAATSAFFIPVNVGYSIVASPHTIWDFRVATDVSSILNGALLASGGFTWYHSFGGSFQLGLGLDVFVGGVSSAAASLLSTFGIASNTLAVFPVPDLTLTWKF